MVDLISRAAAMGAFMGKPPEYYHTSYIVGELNCIPAVDAVPVIRCRDCKYGKLCFDANGQGLIQCTNPYYPASFAETWPFDLGWYCAGGERRDSE